MGKKLIWVIMRDVKAYRAAMVISFPSIGTVVCAELCYRRDLSMAPVSNLIPVPGSMMGERFIYFTFAGMIPLLLGGINDQVWGRFRRQIILMQQSSTDQKQRQ